MENFTRGVGGVLGTSRAEFWQILTRYFADYEHFDGKCTRDFTASRG